MRYAVAAALSLLAGIAAVIITTPMRTGEEIASPFTSLVILLGIGAAAGWYMLRGATTLDVARRGFLFGALEWVVGFVLMLVGGTMIGTSGGADAALPGFLAGGLMGCIGLVFALVCVLGYFLTSRMAREQAASGMKTCPACAEQVQGAAQVCRFCGYSFVGPPVL